MSLLDSVLNYLRGKENGDVIEAPAGVCPICWGHSEYDNKVRKIVRDHQIDVNAGRENYAFIQNFVVNQLEGIKLKNTSTGTICPNCKTKG